MIVFTVIGVVMFWWVMGCIGYGLGMFLDVRRGLHRMTEPVDNVVKEIEHFVALMTVMYPSNEGAK